MEPELTDVSRSEPSPPKELRALTQLRDRIEAAAHEVERLRAENAALATRVSELQAHTGADGPPALPGGENPEKLKTQIEGFIAAIDRVLHVPEPAARQRDG